MNSGKYRLKFRNYRTKNYKECDEMEVTKHRLTFKLTSRYRLNRVKSNCSSGMEAHDSYIWERIKNSLAEHVD